MAVSDDLSEALNTCIDRLNQGETVDDILQDNPSLLDQLGPMLEAGLLYPKARVPVEEVAAAEAAGEAVIRRTVRYVFRGGPGIVRWLLLFLIITGTGGFVIFSRGAGAVTWTSAQTATGTPTATVTATPTATVSPTTMPSSTPLLTATAGVTATALATSASSPTTRPLLTSTVASDVAIITIEGPVTRIDAHIIVIYDIALTIASDDPLLSIIRPGDILRVEGARSAGSIQVISIVFINILVVVDNGRVWRGDDCAVLPPDWVQDRAALWYVRCASPAPASGGFSGRSNDDDDDDD